MSATGVLVSVEDLGVIPGKATDGHAYQQWRFVLDTEHGRWMATSGRHDFAERGKRLIGQRVYIARGGKEGIMGDVRPVSMPPQEEPR